MTRTLRQAFENTFQPAEIAVKKALGIKKLKKGQLFDKQGFVKDGREKLTRYALFVPFYQKIKFITNVNEFGNGAHSQNRGGGATLYTLKIRYKFFGIQIFSKTLYIFRHPNSSFCLSASVTHNIDFGNIGKYAATNTNIEQEIFALINGLDKASKKLVLRQIALSLQAYKENDGRITALTQYEINELAKIHTDFLPNIFQLSENLFVYDEYFLPINHFEIGVFWHKHSLLVFEPQTLTKMRQKDFVDVGGFIGDSAIIFEREFCDKNIYTFEATQTNFKLMQQTLRLNNSSRIIPINKGLGAQASTMQININAGASSIVVSLSGEVENIQIITLDEFVRENKIEVGFIKVDIEGFEMEFLKGAKETICTQKPAMLLSIYHQGSDYFGIKPLIESWNLGYTFKICKGVDGSVTAETALFCEVLE